MPERIYSGFIVLQSPRRPVTAPLFICRLRQAVECGSVFRKSFKCFTFSVFRGALRETVAEEQKVTPGGKAKKGRRRCSSWRGSVIQRRDRWHLSPTEAAQKLQPVCNYDWKLEGHVRSRRGEPGGAAGQTRGQRATVSSDIWLEHLAAKALILSSEGTRSNGWPVLRRSEVEGPAALLKLSETTSNSRLVEELSRYHRDCVFTFSDSIRSHLAAFHITQPSGVCGSVWFWAL